MNFILRATNRGTTAAVLQHKCTFERACRLSSNIKDPWDVTHKPTQEYSPPTYRPPKRPNESLDAKKSRLMWYSRKRGILETDLLLSTFAAKHLNDLPKEKLEAYDALLEENDWDIYYWATRKKPVPEHVDGEIIRSLQEIADNPTHKILRMPSLGK